MTWPVHYRLLGASLAWLLGVSGAVAQDARRLSIPAQPMTTAVLQLGAQAGVSISAGAAVGCGRSRALTGTYNIEAALRRLLAGSGCTYRRIDQRTYMIVAQPAPPLPPPRRPNPTPPLPVVASQLDEVVVTATRRELNLAGAPYALSSVDGASFDAAARRDTSALATRLAGLTVTNLGPGRNKLFVRGLADSPLTGQTQAMVGLL